MSNFIKRMILVSICLFYSTQSLSVSEGKNRAASNRQVPKITDEKANKSREHYKGAEVATENKSLYSYYSSLSIPQLKRRIRQAERKCENIETEVLNSLGFFTDEQKKEFMQLLKRLNLHEKTINFVERNIADSKK